MSRVFVYGTLKRGHRNCHFLQGAEFLGDFTTQCVYSMYEFEDYPAVCLHGGHAIEGEVYRVTDRQFRMLDDHQARTAHARDLPRQFAADRAAAAGDKHPLAVDELAVLQQAQLVGFRALVDEEQLLDDSNEDVG